MEEMVTQGSIQSALTCIEESYCVGDVIIASSAVIGRGVVLRADPGCSITIRDGVCLGPGVIIHATQGAIELNQGVCLAGGVLIIGKGFLGRQVCIGSGTTLINPELSNATMVGADCLWGDESRRAENQDARPMNADPGSDIPSFHAESSNGDLSEAEQKIEQNTASQQPVETVAFESKTVTSKTVIGKQQFETMLKTMFPERDAFRRSQSNSR